MAVSTSVTVDIAKDIQAELLLLKNDLERAMMKFRQKNPDFCQVFKDARVIVDLYKGRKAASTTPTPHG